MTWFVRAAEENNCIQELGTVSTPPKVNMSLEKRPFQKKEHKPSNHIFEGLCWFSRRAILPNALCQNGLWIGKRL